MTPPGYDPSPRYLPAGRPVVTGWFGPVAELPRGPLVLAVDGPELVDWERLVTGLAATLGEVTLVDTHEQFADWATIVAAPTSAELPDDPDFVRLADGSLADLMVTAPELPGGVVLVHGPGAALLPHDVLWYVDRPKRFAEAEIVAGRGRNLGQPAG